MPRSPSLVLAAVLVATLAAPNVRGEVKPPVPAPPPGAGPPSSRLLQRSPAPRAPRRKGLMIGGLVTLGGSYLLTVLFVLNSMTPTNGMVSACGDDCKARPRLLVPIAGPWLAMPYGKGDDTTLFAVLGLAQAAGVVLASIGISQFIADAPTGDEGDPAQRSRQSRSTPQVSVGLLPVRDGAFGFASARF